MIPILVAQVSTAGITFINTTMAGHAGADDLAGVSVGAGLFYPILASIIGLLMAGTPMMAQLLGQKKKEDLPLIVRTGLMIGLFISAVFAAGYFLFVDNLMEYLALEPAVEHIARGYLLSMVGVVTFVTLIIPLRCLTDTAGSTSVSMKLFLIAPPVNAVLDYLFIYGHFGFPRLGGIGAGVATMITYGCLLALFLAVILTTKEFMGKNIFSSFKIRRADLKEYLVVGVPSGMSIFMEMSLFSLIIVFLARYGTDTLAAYQIADNFASLVYMLPVSCSMALTILIATAAGAGDISLARRYKKAGFITAMAGALMTVSFTLFFRHSIGMVYTDDAAVAAIAAQFLIYSAGWQLFDAISTPIQGILRGLKDTRVSFVLMVLRLFYVERVMDGRPVPVIDNILAFFKLKTAASGMPAYAAAFSGEDHSIRAVVEMNIKQAEKLIAFMTEMEEKLSVLIQNVKEAEVDIFTETRRVLPIRKALLTDLHLSILGHATRAYVP